MHDGGFPDILEIPLVTIHSLYRRCGLNTGPSISKPLTSSGKFLVSTKCCMNTSLSLYLEKQIGLWLIVGGTKFGVALKIHAQFHDD
ncbi:hypothetical protein Pelo_1187 [Pelomyxa schiedti]|nr:hypothetical protein Pelo_1187 [Pelomyxa schiedti]